MATPEVAATSFVSQLDESVTMAARVNDVDAILAPFVDAFAEYPELGLAPPSECEDRWTGWATSISFAIGDEQVLALEGPIARNQACAATLPGPFQALTRQGEGLAQGNTRLLSGATPRHALTLASAATQGAQLEAWADVQALMPPQVRGQVGALVSAFGLDGEAANVLAQEAVSVGLAIRTREERALSLTLILPEDFDRAPAIALLESARDRLVADMRRDAEALGETPTNELVNRVIAMSESVRFRANASGIVADVVASLGDFAELALVAIPAFVEYVRAAKATEPSIMLQGLFMRLQLYYAEFQTVPTSAGPIPAVVPRSEAQTADFSGDPVFVQLGFMPLDTIRYSYSIVPTDDPNIVLLRAEGDLDGDGERSRFELTVTCEPTGGCVASELHEESPYE
ncbi:MAG: hypothetical protein ACI9KE_000563 [Polyangiales bacterium]|jgi:hypothetical protein